ncbi:protein toll-like isoform X2 [Drosophila kikkawai]|uniref:Protein toll-like isoform X2 n=1 Tax=Drosophila kikkawai TaxID=30033 RepID=A0ABM4GRB9_DROKI
MRRILEYYLTLVSLTLVGGINLGNIQDDYCKLYWNVSKLSEKSCHKNGTFVITNEYRLTYKPNYLLVLNWTTENFIELNIVGITNKIQNLTYMKIFGIRNTEDQRLRPSSFYLKKLNIEYVYNFEINAENFTINETKSHFEVGPKYLEIRFKRSVSLGLINDYVAASTKSIKTLSIRGLHRPGTDLFSHLKFLSLTELQENVLELNLDVVMTVKMKYFENYRKLRYILIEGPYEPFENLTAFICNKKMKCKFTMGKNGRKCPANCQCTYRDMFIIDCRKPRKSRQIPPLPIPADYGIDLRFPGHQLIQLPNNTLPGYIKVLKLDVSDNNINSIAIHQLPKELYTLDISNNPITTLDDRVADYLSKNSLNSRHSFGQRSIRWIVYCEQTHLLHLLHTNSENYLKSLDEETVDFYNNHDNTTIELSGNPWNCICKPRSFLFFLKKRNPAEYRMTMDRCGIPMCPDSCVCCLNNLNSSSLNVDCRGQRLKQLPLLPESATSLDLRDNNITEINLQSLDILKNKILSKGLKLSLSGNPWTCTCDLFTFTEKFTFFIQDFKEIECSNLGKRLEFVEESDACPSYFIYPLLLFVFSMIIITVLNAFVYFKQPILMWFYEHEICMSMAVRVDLERMKKFDAFLCFTHKDERLIEDYVERLEKGQRQFRLCFYLRDWNVGASIPECIIQSVKDSRRIIILMTKNFLESTWGKLEFRLALHATSKDRCKRLIVILYPDVENFDELDSELKAYMVLNTYLRRDSPNFWNKLLYSMPHVT